ncbi:MAG: sensor histidine kinase [Actinomycetota bacterium]
MNEATLSTAVSTDSLAPTAFAVVEDGRLLIDSEALDQAVYQYRPVLDEAGERIVDLYIERLNEAARRLTLATHITEGRLASEVYVDLEKALDAATAAWHGNRTATYHIERRGIVGGLPFVVHYEIATMRAGDHLVQVSVDHTAVSELASVDARFRLMAEANNDGLMLLAIDPEHDVPVLVYANAAALRTEPRLRVGSALPPHLADQFDDVLLELTSNRPVRRYGEHELPSRRMEVELVFAEAGDDQVLVTMRELSDTEVARAALERSDRIPAALGEGAFGTIAVYEPQYRRGELFDLLPTWKSSGHETATEGVAPLQPAAVLSATDLVDMARQMLVTGEHRRSGWVSMVMDGSERSVEFTLVLAGDRFVLEFVERTAELAAQTTLAMAEAGAEAQRNFLSRVSHELRTPLNVIHGYSQLLGAAGLPERSAGHVRHIEEGVERMVQVVDDLLLLGQLDHGLVRLDRSPVATAQLIDSVLEASRSASWWVDGALLRSDEPGPLGAVVDTDPTHFVSMALMVAEASSAVHPGIEVGTFLRGARAGLRFTAPDHSEVVRSVWRPFLHQHALPGSGMGLAVARGIAGFLGVSLELRDDTRPGCVSLVLLTHIAG